MRKVYLDEIEVTVKLYNRRLEEGTLDNFTRALYCGRFLAIKGIIEGDDALDLEEVETWAAYLDKAASRAIIGEVIIIESKGI